jgi:hypothetical protein
VRPAPRDPSGLRQRDDFALGAQQLLYFSSGLLGRHVSDNPFFVGVAREKLSEPEA